MGEFNIDDFLKEGGVDVNEENMNEDNNEGNNEEEKKEDPSENTDPDEHMSGYLMKSTIKMQGDQEGADLIGNLITGIGAGVKFGFKMLSETIIKQKKNYFAIKNGILYWYTHEKARSAKKYIPISEAKAVELDEKNPKEFYIIYNNKCYKLESQSEFKAQKWYNSLKLVRDSA